MAREKEEQERNSGKGQGRVEKEKERKGSIQRLLVTRVERARTSRVVVHAFVDGVAHGEEAVVLENGNHILLKEGMREEGR